MGYYGMEMWDFDEARDGKAWPVWFCDGKDSYPANKPLDLWWLIDVAEHHNMQYGAEMLSLPGTRSFEWRLKGPAELIAVIEPTEEERRQREAVFRERALPFIEDYEGQWRGKLVPQCVRDFEQLKKVDVERLSDIELREHLDEWLHGLDRAWKAHWIGMYSAYTLYLVFEEQCQELLRIDDTHPKFKALMSGFENRTFQTDRGLWRLADRAHELGLEKTFEAVADDEELLLHLGQSEAGRSWLRELNELLEKDGWRCSGHPIVVSNHSWVEKPSLALPSIRKAIAKGGAFILERERERLAGERERAEKDVLSGVPPDKRDWFEKLMRTAQWAGRFSEEHQFYIENYFNALGRRLTKEMGKRFARAGSIEDAEDIYFLLPVEIRLHFIGRDRYRAHDLVDRRKEQYEEYLKAEPVTFIGDISHAPRLALVDPVIRIISGVPVVKPELKADLYAVATAPGVVEGSARVIFSEAQFPQVQPGEILVTVVTTPLWTPLFSVVKGVVTDFGGSLSHAVIVGREYGLPVVAGTGEGTRKIKTGDIIRVDGNAGAIYILRR